MKSRAPTLPSPDPIGNADLASDGVIPWRDPLPPLDIPADWKPPTVDLAERKARLKARTRAFDTRVGAGVLAKRV